MKFYIRRAVVGIISVPVVAGLYILGYVALMLMGADPSANTHEVFTTGIEIGVLVAVLLTFAPQLSKFLDRLTGE